MQIDVLVCEPDGTQRVVQREVADDFFTQEPLPESVPDYEAFLAGLMEGYIDE